MIKKIIRKVAPIVVLLVFAVVLDSGFGWAGLVALFLYWGYRVYRNREMFMNNYRMIKSAMLFSYKK